MPFGLSLTGNKSKEKTTSTGTFNNTTTPIVPDWASDLVQRGAGRVDSLFGVDPASQVAPANPLLIQAAQAAGALGGGAGSDTSWVQPLLNADTPFASGGKAYNYVDQYLNPYLKEVVDSSAADLDSEAGRVRAQQALDLAGSGAFGGSGAALTQSLTEGELARARAATLSGLRSRAYETALGAASGDAERATQARIANAQTRLQDQGQKADLGFRALQQALAADSNQRANIATQADLAAALRGVDQEQRSAPVTNAQQIVALLSGLPINLFTGQTEQGTRSDTSTKKTSGVTLGAEGKF